jgi:hypothetical protein
MVVTFASMAAHSCGKGGSRPEQPYGAEDNDREPQGEEEHRRHAWNVRSPSRLDSALVHFVLYVIHVLVLCRGPWPSFRLNSGSPSFSCTILLFWLVVLTRRHLNRADLKMHIKELAATRVRCPYHSAR